jgi:hypothetical protein
MSRPSVEVLLAGGYALFLLGVGVLLEVTAGRVARRAHRWRIGGFTYHEQLDAWQCPQGAHLWPREVDHELRLVRYRARAETCNACPVKAACTDSDDGREVVRPLDPWLRSEVGRFHRGMSLALAALAAFLLLLELARHHAGADLAVLAAALAVVAAAGWRLLAAFAAAAVPAQPPAGPGTRQAQRRGEADPGPR